MFRLALPALFAAAIPFSAASADVAKPFPRIVVTGQGEASTSPDMAIVSLSVMREAESAREALDENNAAMAAVIAAMKEAGIAPRDLQTAGLSIQPRYVYPSSGGEEQPRIAAYQVSNTLTVRVRDISAVGAIIDRSVTLGVNQGGSITFTNEDPSAVIDEARKRAVRDAVNRAGTLADAAGVPLGSIVEISETQPDMPQPVFIKARMKAADGSVPVEAGENTYRISVNVTFSIGRD